MAELLALATALTILGPGALAPADPGVLEAVEVRRVKYGWGLAEMAPAGVVLIGIENCDLLGYGGVAVVEDMGWIDVFVVDCEADVHAGQMQTRGLLADINNQEFAHKKAFLLLYDKANHPRPVHASWGE